MKKDVKELVKRCELFLSKNKVSTNYGEFNSSVRIYLNGDKITKAYLGMVVFLDTEKTDMFKSKWATIEKDLAEQVISMTNIKL